MSFLIIFETGVIIAPDTFDDVDVGKSFNSIEFDDEVTSWNELVPNLLGGKESDYFEIVQVNRV